LLERRWHKKTAIAYFVKIIVLVFANELFRLIS